MLLALARWLKSTGFCAALAGSTWAYPVIGALHVLGLAWFGGAALNLALNRNAGTTSRAMLWTGAAFMFATGVLLFAAEPVRCVASGSFWAKMLLLLALAALSRVRSNIGIGITLTLWAGVLLASRGIAFF